MTKNDDPRQCTSPVFNEHMDALDQSIELTYSDDDFYLWSGYICVNIYEVHKRLLLTERQDNKMAKRILKTMSKCINFQ